jgi:hypothetical protein
MTPESDKYPDILKVLEFGAEGGGEALYRLLAYGSADQSTGCAWFTLRMDARPGVNLVWRTYGQKWKLYDLVACRLLALPQDDRDDSLQSLGITGGGQSVALGLG